MNIQIDIESFTHLVLLLVAQNSNFKRSLEHIFIFSIDAMNVPARNWILYISTHMEKEHVY